MAFSARGKTNNCNGCNNPLDSNDDYFLQCCICEHTYHCECLSISKKQYQGLNREYKATWKCPSCSNVTHRKQSNIDTPVRSKQVPLYEESMDTSYAACNTVSDPVAQHVRSEPWKNDFNNFCHELKATLSSWRDDMDSRMQNIRTDIKDTLTDIKNELKSLRVEQTIINQRINTLTKDVSELQTSVQFQSEECVDLKKRVDDLAKSTGCSDKCDSSMAALETKLDVLEQQARQCNIEICNVPERRNENLLGVIEAVGNLIKYPIAQKDIVSVHRVPHASFDDKKPKNIVVKFTSRIMRDNVLSAFRKRKEVKSDQIGVAGTPLTVYMNEHLTLKKKKLFRVCKDIAKKNNFKYIWVKNATILVRETDTAPAIAIRSELDLGKITRRQGHSSNSEKRN